MYGLTFINMKRYAIFLILLTIGGIGFCQEPPATSPPALKDARSAMALRGTTRDQVMVLRDNHSQSIVQKRNQQAINKQRMLIQKRTKQFQQQKIMHNRSLQRQHIRQQAARRQQMQRR